MKALIDLIVSNPVLIWIGVILAIALFVGIVKKLFKLIIVVIVVCLLGAGYLYFFGGQSTVEKLQKRVEEVTDVNGDEVKDNVKQSVETAREKAKDAIEKSKSDKTN